MTFEEAENSYRILRQQLAARLITPQVFAASVSNLRVQDEQGYWWQPRDVDGAWMCWNGQAWVIAAPPGRLPIVPPQPAQPGLVAAQPGYPAASSKQPVASPQAVVAPRRSSSPVKAPETLLQLFILVLKGMLKGLLIKIPFMLGLGLFVWLLHTFLLVGPNGGFGAGTSAVLDWILALRGRLVSGTLFWTLLGLLVTTIAMRFIKQGPGQVLREITSSPAWLKGSFQHMQAGGWVLLLGASAFAMLGGVYLNNGLDNFMLAALTLGSVFAQGGTFTGLVIKLAHSDAQRWLKITPRRNFSTDWYAGIFGGLVLGFLLSVFYAIANAIFTRYFPGYTLLATCCGCAGVIFLGAGAGSLALMRKNKSAAARAVLILAMISILFLAITPALADDGGWTESGSNFLDWIRSQGALIAISMGLPPALGAALGVLIGLSIGTVIPIEMINDLVNSYLGTPMNQLTNRIQDLITQKIKEGYFVRNPSIPSKAWNNTLGWVINEGFGNYKGGQCGEFQDWGHKWADNLFVDLFGKDTITTDITITRNILMNHTANRIILPNGDRIVIDFWEGMQDGKPRIYTEREWRDKWKEKLGGNPDIQRSEHELFFEKCIRENGPEKGLEVFRRGYRNNPGQGEAVIKSYQKDPWFDPNPPEPVPPQPAQPIPDGEMRGGRWYYK